jgi:hypothetical protein
VRDNFQHAHDEIGALQAAGPYAPLASPALTGNPTAPTPSPNDNDTSIATTAYVQGTVGSYLPLAGGTITGNLTVTGTATSNLSATKGTYYEGGANAIGFNWASPAITARVDATSVGVVAFQSWVSGGFLPLAGGTVNGNVTATGAVSALQVNVGTPAATDFYLGISANYRFLAWRDGVYSMVFDNTTGTLSWTMNSVANTMTLDFGGNLATVGSVSASGNVTANGVFSTNSNGVIYNKFGAQQIAFQWTPSLVVWIGGVNAGVITVTSDYRIKRDVVPLPSLWEAVRALRPVSYRLQNYTPAEMVREADAGPFIVGDDVERWGFVAHELQAALIADAASGEKDAPGLIQSPNPWTVLASVTRALQEAMARIEALEATHPIPG